MPKISKPSCKRVTPAQARKILQDRGVNPRELENTFRKYDIRSMADRGNRRNIPERTLCGFNISTERTMCELGEYLD